MDGIKLLMCGNEGVYSGLLLTALSCVKHTKRPIELYIGTMSLTDIDERYTPISKRMAQTVEGVLKEGNPDSCVHLLDFSEDFRRELADSKNMTSSYTPYAMIRLFADRIEGVGDKLLYFDTDVCPMGDIGELYDLDVEGYHMAGVRDYFGKFFFGNHYLNSGVLLFNMKRMREDGVFPRCITLCRDKKMLLFDQHALNKYAKKKLILHRRFNEQKSTRRGTLIRHFAMTIKWLPYFRTQTVKPWQPDRMHSILHDYAFDDVIEKWQQIVNNDN